jgi:hypothetical protein
MQAVHGRQYMQAVHGRQDTQKQFWVVLKGGCGRDVCQADEQQQQQQQQHPS